MGASRLNRGRPSRWHDERELLERVRSLEARSEHPLARAILAYAKDRASTSVPRKTSRSSRAPARGRRPRRVVQSLRAARVLLRPPYRPDKKLEPVEVMVILAQEENPPAGEELIEWLLLSSLPVESFGQACEIIQWYLCRWQIEVYFHILKNGCKVEQLQLRAGNASRWPWRCT